MTILLSVVAAAALAAPVVRPGVDVLVSDPSILAGKRVGVITNHTGRTSDGRPTVDALRAAGVDVAAVFSPEHGFSGSAEAGEKVRSSTGVFSLYGETLRPTPEMLRGLDVLVFDIQDVGARFYTYLTTMAYAMEEAAKHGLGFVVLDRPNPVTGRSEGPVLEPGPKAFTAYFPVPVRHGLTAGETARLHLADAGLELDLRVVELEGWKRGMWLDETGLEWRNPSPNIRSLEAAALYPGIGCFEATNVSVGRGTPFPFQWFGAPWLNQAKLVADFDRLAPPGVRLRPSDIEPDASLYEGEQVPGVFVDVTDREALRPFDLFVHLAVWLRENAPEFQPDWKGLRRMTGTSEFERLYKSGAAAEAMIRAFEPSTAAFLERRKAFLLYD